MLPTFLAQLELSLDDIEDLSEEQQYKIIRNQWMKLSLKWHPDKNNSPEAAARFQQINQAYKALTGKNSKYRPEITQYFI